MNSTRRGFLGFLGGGAVAGPRVLKEVVAQVSAYEKAGATLGGGYGIVGQSLCSGTESKGDWRAAEILNMLRHRNTPPRVPNQYEEWFADIHALKSVSMVNKCRMQRERNMDQSIARELQQFIKDNKLNWVGLDESQILSLVKKAAGE